ncbi:MAG TPA: ABC transporter permease [Burkholderiaceae bacterium]|nr:ABC transporter permease [Burkholderiaceae bacterium]
MLSLRQNEYVTAARALGFRTPRILFRHILPGVAPVLVVQATIILSHAIIAEASLSFLGVGAAPPAPSWGAILNSGFNYLEGAPWLWLAPGLTIFLTVFGINMLGDGLRFAVDPRSED